MTISIPELLFFKPATFQPDPDAIRRLAEANEQRRLRGLPPWPRGVHIPAHPQIDECGMPIPVLGDIPLVAAGGTSS